jgi:hypothetical protein
VLTGYAIEDDASAPMKNGLTRVANIALEHFPAAVAAGTPVRDGTSADALAIMKLLHAIGADDDWRRRSDVDPVELG